MNYNFYIHFISLRTSGIEPESRPWKGGVLPLYYMRVVVHFLFCFVCVCMCVCVHVCVCVCVHVNCMF